MLPSGVLRNRPAKRVVVRRQQKFHGTYYKYAHSALDRWVPWTYDDDIDGILTPRGRRGFNTGTHHLIRRLIGGRETGRPPKFYRERFAGYPRGIK